MIKSLIELAHHKIIWLGLVIFGTGLEAVALYYQYALDEMPCIVCIHIRMWVAVIILVGLFALITNSVFNSNTSYQLNRVWHLLNLGAAVGFFERSYHVLAVERAWVVDSCGMGLDLPEWLSWLKVDQWIPWMFEAQVPCGYTPNVFVLTMAEALVGISALYLVGSIILALLSWLKPAKTAKH